MMGVWSSLETMINGRPEPQLRPVPGLSMHLPPRDDPFVATLDPIASADFDGLAVGIAYRDASGRPSLRTIRCMPPTATRS